MSDLKKQQRNTTRNTIHATTTNTNEGGMVMVGMGLKDQKAASTEVILTLTYPDMGTPQRKRGMRAPAR